MYKEDYKKGGFKMLPVLDPEGGKTFQQIFWYSFILVPISAMPTLLGLSGRIYFIGSLILGIMLFMSGRTLSQSHSVSDARRLVKATVFYLPLLFVLIVLDGTF